MSAHSLPYGDQVSPKIRALLRKYFGTQEVGGMMGHSSSLFTVLFANCEQGMSF